MRDEAQRDNELTLFASTNNTAVVASNLNPLLPKLHYNDVQLRLLNFFQLPSEHH